MKQVQVQWTGDVDTRVEVERGGAKLPLEAKQKFTCSHDVYVSLHKVDKRFKLVGHNDAEVLEEIQVKEMDEVEGLDIEEVDLVEANITEEEVEIVEVDEVEEPAKGKKARA
jgi:hypothetical protein